MSSITPLAWDVLEEASAGPVLVRRCNPGTIWSLNGKGLIAYVPPFADHVVLTDAGENLLRRRRAEIASLAHRQQE